MGCKSFLPFIPHKLPLACEYYVSNLDALPAAHGGPLDH